MARGVTVNDVLDGHVALDIQCLDRIYLNAYVPVLQTSSQVVALLSGHLGFPFPSPVLFRQLGDRFRNLKDGRAMRIETVVNAPATWAATPACPTWTSSRPRPAPATW